MPFLYIKKEYIYKYLQYLEYVYYNIKKDILQLSTSFSLKIYNSSITFLRKSYTDVDLPTSLIYHILPNK